jgi:hypothetical protein
VKTVAVAAPGTATRAELPLRAGPAGFASLEEEEDDEVSPGWSEMRVVFGVQLAAPRQVSRTKTWRKPLSGVEVEDGDFAADFASDFALLCDFVALGVTARKAMKRPEALTDGRMASVPTSAPFGSVEMSCVEGEHWVFTPVQVSRK